MQQNIRQHPRVAVHRNAVIS